MPVALDRRVSYFGNHLSENIAETPEGYRICRNAVIGRSGFQTYKVSEIADPEGLLADRYSENDELPLWRDPAEVFSPATIASFEGKSFTLTHPDELLDPDNDSAHNQGHVQNVRRGDEPLEDGSIPLLADIVVKGRDAIRAIDAGERELSCGYTYKLGRDGYRWDQRQILGNHVALVPKGRAGAEARINDAAPAKEKTSVKNYFKHFMGLGFQTFAKDARPEELAEAMDAVGAHTDGEKAKYPKFIQIGTTRDGVKIFKQVAMDDSAEAGNTAVDGRKRMHDMLDRLMDNSAKEDEERAAQDDADLAELKKLLGEKESGKDAAHEPGCDCQECKDKAAADAEKEENPEGAEDAEIVHPEPDLPPADRQKSAFDAQHTLKTLKALKPFIAHANDKKLNAAFDIAVRSVTASVKEQPDDKRNGGYSAFRAAASTAKDAGNVKEFKPRVSPSEKQAREADEVYANARKSALGERKK